MLGVAGTIFIGAVAMLIVGWARRGKPGLPWFGESEQANVGLVLTFGMIIPIGILIALFVVSDIYVLGKTDAPPPGTAALTVNVVGHQWWWEVRYPGTDVVTANEIHIPARTSVEVRGRTADVIHSFWVPELNRKIDLIPGMTNRVELFAERDGRYRGQCAEFCGLQHAHMAFYVIAEPRPQFERWLAGQEKQGRIPTTAAGREGQELFMENACASCHTIAGTEAQGKIGPSLTHVGSRETLAALMIENTPAELLRWIEDPQAIKPGAKMPGLELSHREFEAIATYLSELR